MKREIKVTQPYDECKTDTWTIESKEPDGWLKAYEVKKNGEHKAFFRYADDAESYVMSKTTLRG